MYVVLVVVVVVVVVIVPTVDHVVDSQHDNDYHRDGNESTSDDHDIRDDEKAETDCPSSSGEGSGSFRSHCVLKPVVSTQFENKLFATHHPINFQ